MKLEDPLKHLRSELERNVLRAWEDLTEGWRELLSRSGAALTHFASPDADRPEAAVLSLIAFVDALEAPWRI